MGRDRAAYMREYRKRKAKARRVVDALSATDAQVDVTIRELAERTDRIIELEAEVARLKRELAARPTLGTYSTRPFTPVPKRGK